MPRSGEAVNAFAHIEQEFASVSARAVTAIPGFIVIPGFVVMGCCFKCGDQEASLTACAIVLREIKAVSPGSNVHCSSGATPSPNSSGISGE